MEPKNTTGRDEPASESDDFARYWAETTREMGRFFYQLNLAYARDEGYARGFAGAFARTSFPKDFNETFQQTLNEAFDQVLKELQRKSVVSVHGVTEANRSTEALRLVAALACRTLDIELDGEKQRDLARRSEPELHALVHTLTNERHWPAQFCFRWTADGPEDVEIVDYHS